MRRLLALFALLASAVFSPARAQGTTTEAEQNALRLAELAELRTQVELTSARVEAMLARLSGALKPDEQARVGRTFRRAFDAAAMHEAALAYVRRRAAEPEARAALDTLGSPLARKMVRLEIEATTPEQRGKLGEYVRSLKPDSPPVQKRVELAARLDAATRASEQLAELNIRLAKSFTASFFALSPPAERPPPREQERLLAQVEAKLREDFEGAGVLLFLFAFRTVADAELEQYAKLYETKEGRWFAAVKWGALAEAFAAAGRRFGAELSGAASR